MGKLKNLTLEVVSLLLVEEMNFNQISKEMNVSKDIVADLIDLLLDDGVIDKNQSKYFVTNKAKDLFGC